jgi:heme-degrading monooxygenase HmoA
VAPRFIQIDPNVAVTDQFNADTGPVVLINQFTVAERDVDAFLHAWAEDAAWFKQQPGYISAQLHRGIAGSTTFVNVAVWESAKALGQAVLSPEVEARLSNYPESATIAPHLFVKVAVPGICTA